ncbi:dihydroneopterin aldolase [Pseudomonas sp. MYb185]|uniref:dihydroneopterin aldolase n=1 Tax=Pseudomonas sp. MYb185 TaxID=1848729 RepID=UPI000CFD57F2|nr:dihydroneopterin aldolase [Pseudomonas sp. MYb185]PRB80853.1 dihydroneopterin aldolase [Pseudomonas sp. MYb185]
MDQVFIRGLEVETVIGAYDWERNIRQRLLFDLDMAWDIRAAAAQDDLALALDYAAVSQRVLDYVSASSFELIESLAERVAELVMSEFGVPWLRLSITKPGAVKAATGGVGVLIERGERRA